jgi:hypothetical protein
VRRAVVCDGHDASWIDEARAVANGGDTWDIVLVGVSEPAFRRRCGAELARLSGVRFVDTTSVVHDARSEVSAYVLDLVARLPSARIDGLAIGEWLRHPGGSLWWSLEITEKSAFRGSLLERLFRLSVLDRVLADGDYAELWNRMTDRSLADIIAAAAGIPTRAASAAAPGPGLRERTQGWFPSAYWARAIRACLQAAGCRAVATLAGLRSAVHGVELGIFTMYPYWWLDAYTPGATDRFFSALPPTRRYMFAAWLSSPLEIWRRRAQVRLLFRERRLVALQTFLGWRDLLAVLSPNRFRALARLAAHLGGLEVRFRRFDVSTLVAGELRQSLADAEILLDDLIRRAVRAFVRRSGAGVILYRAEGQPWESALLLAAGPAATTIGFYHSPFGRLYPALRFAPQDFSTGPAGPRPLPGGALVCGSATRRYMIEDGYPDDRIAACGPQRHARFIAFRASAPDRITARARLALPADRILYFVSLAIVEIETEGLFACLESALRGRDGYHLLVKTHPNRPAGDAALRQAVEALGTDRVSVLSAGSDMYDYLAAADAMITIGSTVAFEAMALGVMPVVYEHPGTYAATSLRAFESALFVVDSPASMRHALGEIESGGQEYAGRRACWPAAIGQVFGDMSTPLAGSLDSALRRLGA